MSSSGYAAEMQVRDNVRMLYSRVQTLLNRRSKQKRAVEIVSLACLLTCSSHWLIG